MSKKAPTFVMSVDDVVNVGACSKASYIAISWLLNKEASTTTDACVLVKQTMPDGRTWSWVVQHTEDSTLYFPWEYGGVRIRE